jgi:membrane associated rhomboid family serine protease
LNNWIEDIKQKYQTSNIAEKLIFINIFVFIFTFVLNTFSALFKTGGNFVIDWFALSPHFNELLFKPWTIITYGFLHSGFFHILFNLIFLYYIGNLFLNFFNKKQFLTYYFLGIVFGGFIYILSYNFFPLLKGSETLLVGASAGVTAILVGLATHIPHYALRFQFFGNIKLMYIAMGFVVLDLIQIPDGNAGGHLAHLGGALIGYLLSRYFNKGKDIILSFENLFQKKEKPLKTVYKNKQTSRKKTTNPKDHQAKIDRILDKISKSGYDTLTKDEKDFLFKVGKN